MWSRVVFRFARYGQRRLLQGHEFCQGWTSQPVHVSSASPASKLSESADNAEPCNVVILSQSAEAFMRIPRLVTRYARHTFVDHSMTGRTSWCVSSRTPSVHAAAAALRLARTAGAPEAAE